MTSPKPKPRLTAAQEGTWASPESVRRSFHVVDLDKMLREMIEAAADLRAGKKESK